MLKVNQAGLYYGKYQYQARFNLTGVVGLRLNGPRPYDRFMEMFANRKRWATSPYGKAKYDMDVAETPFQSIKRLCEWYTGNVYDIKPKPCLIRLDYSKVFVYSNDLPLLNKLEQIDPSVPDLVTYTEVVIDTPPGVKYLQKPAHSFRVYFRGVRCSPELKQDIISLIDRYYDTPAKLVPCPSLSSWLENPRTKWLSNSFFIEYDLESTFTVVSIILGSLLGKKFEMCKRT